eukprot:sb/3477003/
MKKKKLRVILSALHGVDPPPRSLTKSQKSNSFKFPVEFQKPQDVQITNKGTLAQSDQSLVGTKESLVLECSAKSFPESVLTWQYKKSDSDEGYASLDSSSFSQDTTLAKGTH